MPPGALPTLQPLSRTAAFQDNCHLGKCHPGLWYLGQLPPGHLLLHGCSGAGIHSQTFFMFSFLAKWKLILL